MEARSVAALIVTYGRRVDYLRTVVDACWQVGVGSILVVDNDSDETTQEYLRSEAATVAQFSFVYSPINLGSAGGYALGLGVLLERPDVDDIWLLDDDNMPAEGSLASLLYTRELVKSAIESDAILFGFRKHFDRESALVPVMGNIKKADPHFMTVLLNRFRVRSLGTDVNYQIVRTMVGPYGGMFASRELFAILGLPDSSYYLYGDDFEYTSRAVVKRVPMYTVVPAEVIDLDRIGGGSSRFLGNLLDPARVYYSTRNHLFLRRALSTNYLLYILDVFALLAYLLTRLLVIGLTKPKEMLATSRAVGHAVIDSLRGKLGKSNRWPV